jgi:hypothetical protein
MQLQLVFEDQWSVPVWVDDRLGEALGIQRERIRLNELEDIFVDRLSTCFANSLTGCLDVDLQVPTENQVRYATDIARELALPLPAEALRFRGAAHDFIARFDGPFREFRERRRQASSQIKD